VLTLAVTPLALYAADEPHGLSFNTGCLSCHATHKSAGGSLTNAISNESLCTSCHNLGGSAANFPLERFYKADPVNRLGASHAWNVPPTNANAGAAAPNNAQMSVRANPTIICSTCHNQHSNAASGVAAQTAGTQNPAPAVRIAGTGTGTVTYTATAIASARGYLLDVVEVEGAAGTARFRLSNDGGVSWFGYSAGTWVAYTTGNAAVTGASVTLNDGTNIVASFAGNYVIGDRIRFYVGYPFLRAPLDSGDNATGAKFCRDCHRGWAMDYTAVRTYDGTMRSHPVGQALNANGGGYDRVTPLDGNGAVQGGGFDDANPTNDLRLAADSTVQCLTCHGMHHADGNSTTIDTP
jgi:predicted CXXCH cytochrome family protein